MPDLLLASASPARADMLRAAGVDIDIEPCRIDEDAIKTAMLNEGAPPRDVADKLAEMKAARISARHPDRLVLGADQILVHDDTLFSKPETLADARQQLSTLRGSSHQLMSAAVIFAGGEPVWRHIGQAKLTMRPFTDAFMDSYLDKMGDMVLTSVGCYHLEGLGSQLFARVEGDYFTVLGLPLLEVLGFLRARGHMIE